MFWNHHKLAFDQIKAFKGAFKNLDLHCNKKCLFWTPCIKITICNLQPETIRPIPCIYWRLHLENTLFFIMELMGNFIAYGCISHELFCPFIHKDQQQQKTTLGWGCLSQKCFYENAPSVIILSENLGIQPGTVILLPTRHVHTEKTISAFGKRLNNNSCGKHRQINRTSFWG